jgi:integrase
MSKKPQKNPAYRLHRQSGQAIVTLPDGLGGRHDVLLGLYESQESKDKYNRVLGEWIANGRRLVQPKQAEASLTINQVMLAYWRHAESYYVKDGKPTSEQHAIRLALRPVKQLYGDMPAKDFSPLCLKAVREAMIVQPITRKIKKVNPETGAVTEDVKVLHHGLTRRVINKLVSRIRLMFAWAVEEELVPVHVYTALLAVKGLKKGKSQAREKPRVKPVPPAYVEQVLPLVSPTVRTMIEVQRLCGGRPQDIVQIRAIDIDMTGKVWEYRPPTYKTEHHNQDDTPEEERVVFLGPKAQELLKPYLTLNVSDYFFSPARAEDARNKQRRERRVAPLWPSHARRKSTTTKRKAPPRDHYDVASYRRAIRRACEKAGIPIWCPNQLRHARGTEIRKRYGLEASQAVLGHSELGVTQVYAEVDHDTARRVMGEIG